MMKLKTRFMMDNKDLIFIMMLMMFLIVYATC